jgi:serine/threonine-protein kinase HipA
MTSRQLNVVVNQQLIGYLRENNDLWEFEYSTEWINSPDAFDLSPELARDRAIHADGATQRPVQWYFDNLLPEENLRTIIAKEANLSHDDAFALLAHFGAESAGSLILQSDENTAAVEYGLKLLPLTELSQRIINLPKGSLTKDAPKKMSLAGAQHKMLVVLKGNDLFEPLAGTPSTHILKPNHLDDDYAASAMNEYFTMRLADAVGVLVPQVQFRYVPQPIYIIERFDRVIAKNNQAVERRHIIDTCQLLNKARTFKYSAAHIDTLAQAIDLCRSKLATRMQLYRWIVFNILAGNSDNHLKNISFMVNADGIEVAPAYDLLCTAVYETPAMANANAKWPHTELAFTLGKAKTFADITRAHLLEAARVLGLAETTATRELDRLINTIPLEADKLIANIEAELENEISTSPDPEAARKFSPGEMHMLRAIRHIVIADMANSLA